MANLNSSHSLGGVPGNASRGTANGCQLVTPSNIDVELTEELEP